MKLFCRFFVIFGILLWVICGCSIDGDEDYGDEEIPDALGYEGTEVYLSSQPEPTVFLSCRAVSETEINFEFSSPVTLLSLSFNPDLGIDSVEDGSTVKVYLEETPAPGQRFVADILAADAQGNEISVMVPFAARNNRVPELLINELRTEWARPRAEFIEFKMISPGNLGALRVFAASNNKNSMIYEFPPVEVKAGEYVVLHLRTLEEDCRDELGDNLAESGGRDASPTARELWIPGSNKLLRKTDAVYVLDQDDRVLNAVMIAETPASVWNRDYFTEAAEFLYSQGAWESPSGSVSTPADAVNSARIATATTRSISRDETVGNTNTSADWYITVTGGATPGGLNNPNRF